MLIGVKQTLPMKSVNGKLKAVVNIQLDDYNVANELAFVPFFY